MHWDNYDFIKTSHKVEKNIEKNRLCLLLILGCILSFTEIFIALFSPRPAIQEDPSIKGLNKHFESGVDTDVIAALGFKINNYH